jgi:LDH2 family malate/lactate/ureidoglycolate dehydrogenase
VTRVSADVLSRFMQSALVARRVSPEHAEMLAAGLLRVSLRGVDTHGIRLFPTYISELDGGRARAQPRLEWSQAGGAARRLDADGALGLVAGTIASREAVRVAREQGIAAVSVFDSNHFGAASAFTLEMASAGVIGISMTNADALIAPFGGTRVVSGTNPLSIAVAGDDGEMFCLDMATSQVAYSYIKQWLARGQPVATGWAIRPDGSDAAGARSADEISAIQPLGGYKGHGLAMAITLLCAGLANMPFDYELSHLYVPPFDTPRQVAHLFIALDVRAFLDPVVFRRRITEYLRHVRREPPAEGRAVHAPGDLEAIAYRDRVEHGIPMTDEELAKLRALGLAD